MVAFHMFAVITYILGLYRDLPMPITEYSVICRVLRDTMDTKLKGNNMNKHTHKLKRVYNELSQTESILHTYVTVSNHEPPPFVLLRNRYFCYERLPKSLDILVCNNQLSSYIYKLFLQIT